MGLDQSKKSFCTTEETINKVKRKPIEWEKISANHMSNKGLMSNTYKEHIQLNIKQKQTNKKKQIIK